MPRPCPSTPAKQEATFQLNYFRPVAMGPKELKINLAIVSVYVSHFNGNMNMRSECLE